jgi:hypothetical protein
MENHKYVEIKQHDLIWAMGQRRNHKRNKEMIRDDWNENTVFQTLIIMHKQCSKGNVYL